MRVHWLGIGGINIKLTDERKQWIALKHYLNKYPDSKITIFNKVLGRDLYERIVKLECMQSYDDLDLDCNSGFNTSIRHLDYKPKGIEICKMQIEGFLQ